jgi:glutathione S-transferase
MPSLRLIYFKMRALAEAPQLMLRYTQTPYSYEMAWDYFGKPWSEAKPTVAYRQLPMLVVDDTARICQSGAITRFIADLTHLKPDDPLLLAEVDALFETSQELFFPLNPTINFAVGDDFAAKRENLLEQLTPRLRDLERVLTAHPLGPFCFGDAPYYCDFGVFHHVNLAMLLDIDLLDPYPNIAQFISTFEKLDGVREYLGNRPELIDVGTEPKLVIDGIARSTGTVDN